MTKKLFLVLLLCAFAYPQQVDTTVVGNEVLITETPDEIQSVVRKYEITRLQDQYNRALSHRDYYQKIVDELKWILEFEPEVIVPPDELEYEDGYNPIKTATEWRIEYIRTWLTDYNIDYSREATRDELLIIVEHFLNPK